MNPSDARRSLLAAVEEHDRWRREETINLLPSENILSPDALRMVGSDLASRYSLLVNAEVHGYWMDNAYGGTRVGDEIESIGEKLACQVFEANFASLKPIGAHIAGIMLLLGLTERGDTIMTIDLEDGGYDGYGRDYVPAFLGLNVECLPFDRERGTLQTAAAVERIQAIKPKLVIIGASFIPFPYDIPPLRVACDAVSARLVYDGSHVLGLIAGGEFQKPLRDGCDVLLGSTHKSFFGPQGGIVLTNDEEVYTALMGKVTWYTMDNDHRNRIGGVAMALAELAEFGTSYAPQVIANSQALGRVLQEGGLKMQFSDNGFSESHQLVFSPASVPDPGLLSRNLEPQGLIIDRTSRLGTAEVTRLGADEEMMAEIGKTLLAGWRDEPIQESVREIRSRMKLRYCF